jgi:hypothetical protein
MAVIVDVPDLNKKSILRSVLLVKLLDKQQGVSSQNVKFRVMKI